MNLPEKVRIFEKRIRRDDPFGAGTRAQNRGIIADTDAQSEVFQTGTTLSPSQGGRESATYPFDQLIFADHYLTISTVVQSRFGVVSLITF